MTPMQRGFTLVEILVALTVATLLVSLVYGAVRVGQRSVYALDKHTADAELMRIGWQFLHDAVTRALPRNDPEQPDSGTGFTGGHDTLVFVANMPGYVGIAGLTRITLGGRRTVDGEQLLLSRQRLDDDSLAAAEGVEQAVLVDRLEYLRIDYFGRIERDAAPAWRADWDAAQNLPNLVRIAVKPKDAAAWPLLIARPLRGTQPIGEDIMPSDSTESDPTGDGSA